MKHPFVSRRRLFLLEERRAGQKNLSFRRAIDTLFLWQGKFNPNQPRVPAGHRDGRQ